MTSITDSLRRPNSEKQIQSLQKRAYALACKGHYEDALAICDWLIEEPLTAKAGYRKRAAILEHKGDFEAAIEDLRHLIHSGSDEPADFYALGQLQIQERAFEEAIDVVSKGIEICEAERFDYYLNPLIVMRAFACLQKGDVRRTLDDARRLPDGYQTHFYGSGLKTKESLISEAESSQRR